MEYPKLYVRFLYHFNVDQDYYECHEVLEELWLEEGRDLRYQGLLQVAVGLYHHSNRNVSGAIKLFEAGISKLLHYPDTVLGIDLKQLRDDSIAYLQKLCESDKEPFDFYPLAIAIIDPQLQAKVDEMNQEHE
jgi:predicted metal-dependent hydrolase